jgi:protein transport protein SEC61 subunit alpha
VIALLIALIEGCMFIYTGSYGDMNLIGPGNAILIVMQLVFSSLIIVLIDEMLSKVISYRRLKMEN